MTILQIQNGVQSASEDFIKIDQAFFEKYLFPIVFALLILVVGSIVSKIISKGLNKAVEKSVRDVASVNFIQSLFSVGFKILLLILAANALGIETTSLAALIGAAALAIGLALQGSLSNFAGGVMLLTFRPFNIEDVIQTQGFIATVKEIQIFNTILQTADGQTIFIPNAGIIVNPLINLTKAGKRRVEIAVGVSYSADLKKTRALLLELMQKHPLVLKDPLPSVLLKELGDSSVNFLVRPWTLPENYWAVYNDLLEEIKLSFDKEGIEIPFPQQVVHIQQLSNKE